MRVLIVTHDLRESNKHLMPWRTVTEVAHHLEASGNQVVLLSLETREHLEEALPKRAVACSKNRALSSTLRKLCADFDPEIVFWPISWREKLSRLHALRKLQLPVIGYFPGGSYPIQSSFYALKVLGFSHSAPYLAESLTPKWFKARCFQWAGVQHMITMTQFTADSLAQAGWPRQKITVIPPGKDLPIDGSEHEDLPEEFVRWRAGRPFVVFLGPPSAIRGIYELLTAFDRAAEEHPQLTLICLFRADGELDTARIAARIRTLRHKQRIWCIWDSLPKGQLNAFIGASVAVALPFVLVPSEIPLVVLEAMSFGKKVITTGPSGTGDFVSGFGFTVPLGDISALSAAIGACVNPSIDSKAAGGSPRELIDRHPTWGAVAEGWFEAARAVTVRHGRRVKMKQ